MSKSPLEIQLASRNAILLAQRDAAVNAAARMRCDYHNLMVEHQKVKAKLDQVGRPVLKVAAAPPPYILAPGQKAALVLCMVCIVGLIAVCGVKLWNEATKHATGHSQSH